ncbi:MAG: DUF2142 domain-containing protein [Clostridia bacterium]|nr:DUF2142 domain-containing protein [Clostridia bacterium]
MYTAPFWITHRKKCLLICAMILSCLLIFGLILVFSGAGHLIPKTERKLEILMAAVFVALFILELGFLIALAGKAPRLEQIFPLFALGLGLLYLFVITPLSVPDETTHYPAAYELTNNLLAQDEPHAGYAGDFDFSGFTIHNNTADGYRRLIDDFFAAPDHGETIYVDTLSTIWSLHYSVEYFPQMIGLAAARLLRLNFLQSFYLGRFVNLLFYVLCLAIALRRTPRFKLMFGLIGILPMALHQAASFSYDSFINGIAIIFTASLMKAIYDQGLLPRKDYLVLLVCAMLIAPAKGAYCLILLVYLLIPSERFVRKRSKVLSFLLILVACMAMLAVLLLPSLERILGSPGTVSNSASVWEMLANRPLYLVSKIAKTMLRYGPIWGYQAIGVLSGLSLPLPIWIGSSMLLLLILSALVTPALLSPVTVRQRINFLLVCILVLLTFLFAMLLSWGTPDSPFIEGVQGRYLIPVVPLALASLNNRRIQLREEFSIPIAALFSLLSCASVVYVVLYTVAN